MDDGVKDLDIVGGAVNAAFVVALALLFAVFGSNWSLCEMEAVLVAAPALFIVAAIASVAAALVVTVPMVQTPVVLL
jgi:hypothetical protein